ncbi:MAG: glycoside hydrolase family 127 protein [Bacteroidaceae bacterium]|nr:glycoside hydrolase family 127 protein [Bacteroidaceae bacterium]
MKSRFLQMLTFMLTINISINAQTTYSQYPITDVGADKVTISDNIWAKRQSKNRQVTLRMALDSCFNGDRVLNFQKAAGSKEGYFTGMPYDDADVYRCVEAVSHSIASSSFAQLKNRMDQLIDIIVSAQYKDGYIMTARSAAEPDNMHPWLGTKRWEKDPQQSYELYNAAHFINAGIANYKATGSTTLLNAAKKYANLLSNDYINGKLPYEPGYQGIEMSLIDLYWITKNKSYVDLAKIMLDLRAKNALRRNEYNQTHKAVTLQDQAVGNAARATAMYAGMVDVSAATANGLYESAATNIWNDIVNKKMFINGGLGAARQEGLFNDAYELSNIRACCDTRAAINNIYWNHRMFKITGESKYYDVLERTLYNNLLASISIDGASYFTLNPLYSDGRYTRQTDFQNGNVLTDISQFLASVPEYIYANKGDSIYVNLFVQSSAKIDAGNNRFIHITQKTAYPWVGDVAISVDSVKNTDKFDMMIRIPGWVNNEPVPGSLYSYLKDGNATNHINVYVNGAGTSYLTQHGYIIINRKWKKGDVLSLSFPMNVKRVIASDQVTENTGYTALERGPILYCLEWKDNDSQSENCYIKDDASITAESTTDLNGVYILKIKGAKAAYNKSGKVISNDAEITAIPYFAWNNRGNEGEMMVWMPRTLDKAIPLETEVATDTIDYTMEMLINEDTEATSYKSIQITPDTKAIAYYMGLSETQLKKLYGSKISLVGIDPNGKVTAKSTADAPGYWFDNNGNVTEYDDGACVFSHFNSDFTFNVGQMPGTCIDGQIYTMMQALNYYPADNKTDAHRVVIRIKLHVKKDLSAIKTQTININVNAKKYTSTSDLYYDSYPTPISDATLYKALGIHISELPKALMNGDVVFQALEPDGSYNNDMTAGPLGQWLNEYGYVTSKKSQAAIMFGELNPYSCIINVGQYPKRCTVGKSYNFKQAITTNTKDDNGYRHRLVLNVTLNIVENATEPTVITEDGTFCIENFRCHTFVHDFEYSLSDTSIVERYNIGPVIRRDEPAPLPDGWEELDGAEKLRNLYPNRTYKYQVKENGNVVKKGSFKTSGQVRMITTKSTANVRDLGGWKTSNGKSIAYGLLYRGRQLNTNSDEYNTSDSDKEIFYSLGIRAELDLRNQNETGGYNKSMINDEVVYKLIPNPQHYLDGIENHPEYYHDDFEFIIQQLRLGRPTYIHCIAGCDRAGTLAFMLEGLLGVSTSDLCKDYELSTFSYNKTTRKKESLTKMFEYIETLKGKDLRAKFYTYWSEVAKIPTKDIDDFCAIMWGEKSITAINDVPYCNEEEQIITFDLSGRKIIMPNAMTKGIFIQNNKKILAK